MNPEVPTILRRIETDVSLLRKLVSPDASESNGIKVPVLRTSYTSAKAAKAKEQIEAAFRAGLITFDKKRGMKMVVTKATMED